MTIKKVPLVIMTGILVASCGNIQKKEPTEQVKIEKTTDHNWIYGRTYTQEGIPNENPELGGLDFLRFESKEVIELKRGDIVGRVKAKFIGDTIILTDELTNSNSTFKIVNKECLLDKYGIKWKTPLDSEIKNQMINITFTVAKNYFVKNTIDKLVNPKIETAEKFNEIYGMATTMGKDGKPTEIDFKKQYVIAVILPETDLMTTIDPVSLQKDDNGKITLTYKKVVGQKQTYTIKPSFEIIVSKTENGTIELKEQK